MIDQKNPARQPGFDDLEGDRRLSYAAEIKPVIQTHFDNIDGGLSCLLEYPNRVGLSPKLVVFVFEKGTPISKANGVKSPLHTTARCPAAPANRRSTSAIKKLILFCEAPTAFAVNHDLRIEPGITDAPGNAAQ